MNTLVVPGNSPSRLRSFLSAWTPWPWDRIVVVLDLPACDPEVLAGLTPEQAERCEVFSWAEIDAIVPDPSIISRQDSAIRSFGFWHAWRTGADVIVTLDDDCYPAGEDPVAGHRRNLFATPAWRSSVDGLRVRGLPYGNLGVLRGVQLSMGLWQGCPDLDAITTLAGGSSVSITDTQTVVMPSGQYFPMSGMNLAFRRDIACLMYFPPMGRGEPYNRFDDIWCGLVVQRICRHLGYSITCGRPLINHQRASDVMVNLVKEAPGVAANEGVWQIIDDIVLTGTRPRACMLEVGAALARHSDEYVARWGRSIRRWCELYDQVPERVRAVGAGGR